MRMRKWLGVPGGLQRSVDEPPLRASTVIDAVGSTNLNLEKKVQYLHIFGYIIR